MDVKLTMALAAGLAAVAAVAGWRGARPPDLARGPRLVPWRMIMLLAAAGFVFAAAYAVSLLKSDG